MKKAQADFIRLLETALTGQPAEFESIDLNEVERIARNHVCLPLVCSGAELAGLNVPEEWKQHSMRVAANNYRNLTVQNKALKILAENNIRCAVLKGITVAKYYPEPLRRQLGDIDILVDEENYERTIDLLTASAERDAEKLKHKFHYHFTFCGTELEVHKYMTEYEEGENGEIFAEALKNALNTTITGEYDMFKFPMLDEKHLAISLILHTQRHFAEHGITMRMICDFAVFAKNISADTWKNEICPSLRKLGTERFAYALLRACEKYLGAQFEFDTACATDEKIVDDLIEEFLRDGVEASYTAEEITVAERLKNIFAAIGGIARRDFKITEKAPITVPFCCIYVVLRSICRKAMGKRKNISVMGYSTAYSRRNKLSRELDIN